MLSGDLGGDDGDGWQLGTYVGSNCVHVVTFESVADNLNARLDSCVVTRGYSYSSGMEFPEARYFLDRGSGILFRRAQGDSAGPIQGVVQNCEVKECASLCGAIAVAGGNGQNEYHEPVAPPSGAPLPTPSFRTSVVHNNFSSKFAGGMVFDFSAPEVADCVLSDNRSWADAGAIQFVNLPEPGPETPPVARIVNTTIAFNQVLDPQGGEPGSGHDGAGVKLVWTQTSLGPSEVVLTIDNCILAQNSPVNDAFPWLINYAVFNPNEQAGFHVVDVRYTDIGEGDDGILALYVDESCLFDSDPMFASPTPDAATLRRDLRLHPCSPCVDAGDPSASTLLPLDTFDANWNDDFAELLPDRRLGARVLGASVDMGAWERVPCGGDFDGDEVIGASDLAVLLGAWAQSGSECGFPDLDGDGTVGAGDLAVLLGGWGGCLEEVAFSAGGVGGGQSMAFAMNGMASGGLSPEVLASLFGYASLSEFSAWLGTLDASGRAAVLSLLGSGNGGEL